jgi:protein-tyrosine-phosphatase
MAEKLLAHALAAEQPPLSKWTVISAGVSAWPNESASANSVRALKNVGLELNNHRSQTMTDELMAKSLVVIGMTESHRQFLHMAFPESKTPIVLLREFMPPPANPEIPDPYGQNLSAYENCRDSMVEAIPSLIRYLKTLLPTQL